jgi:mitochondrial fission protein ELM1
MTERTIFFFVSFSRRTPDPMRAESPSKGERIIISLAYTENREEKVSNGMYVCMLCTYYISACGK